MPLPESVRIEIKQGGFRDDTLFLYARWTPPGQVEHSLIVGSGWHEGSPDLVAAKSSLENLLLHVYEQGRVDASLGF